MNVSDQPFLNQNSIALDFNDQKLSMGLNPLSMKNPDPMSLKKGKTSRLGKKDHSRSPSPFQKSKTGRYQENDIELNRIIEKKGL